MVRICQIENSEYRVWLRNDQFLMSWLFASIFESKLGHVVRCETSVLQLQFQLQNTKKRPQSIDEYILKMRGVADYLSAASQLISDEELIIYILRGLGP